MATLLRMLPRFTVSLMAAQLAITACSTADGVQSPQPSKTALILTPSPSDVPRDAPTLLPPTSTGTSTPQPATSPAPSEISAIAQWNDERQLRFGDLWAEGHVAYVGRSYDGGGVEIIDISEPARPAHIATWVHPEGNGTSQDVMVKDGIGYFGAEGGAGLHVVDVGDPSNPTTLYTIDNSNGGVNDFHNVFVDGHHLYIADNRTADIRVFNVEDPSKPSKAQTITVPGVDKVHDVTVWDRRLYVSGGHYTNIYDVSDISSPIHLISFITGNKTHSNWPTEDGNFLAVANEVPGGAITIWEVRDLRAPRKIATLDPHELGFEDVSAHNPVIVEDVLYVSWLTAGLQVFSLEDPANPRHLGGFETAGGRARQPMGAGNWGVYPFLGHDRVLLSDEHEGLWIIDASSVVK